MQDVQAKMARINADVAKLREAYGMKQMTMEERAERWRRKQAAMTAIRPVPNWRI